MTDPSLTSAPSALLPIRPSWDHYFMKIATDVATRATCPRKHVGAVIVRDKRILSTGYNASPRRMPHCTDVGCELKDLGGRESCVRTIHAEANAVAQAAQNGVSIEGATIYTTGVAVLRLLEAHPELRHQQGRVRQVIRRTVRHVRGVDEVPDGRRGERGLLRVREREDR
jgi:hypothetical protein